MLMKKIRKLAANKIKFYTVLIAVILIAIIILRFAVFRPKNTEAEIISKSSLEKIIKVSDLSTYEAVYNGVAKVMNEQNPENVDYYVSYDARIKAGIDFEKVEVDVDHDQKVITVKLPEIEIQEVNVDIASLDYIFINNTANTATVSEEAYKKCKEDAIEESKTKNAIYDIAEQNLQNIIEALISPFVEQLDSEYQLQID